MAAELAPDAPAAAPGFRVPSRAIFCDADLQEFHNSETLRDFRRFLKLMSESVKGMAVSDAGEQSPAVQALVGVLEGLHDMVDEAPPQPGPMRFGNRAFRTWHRMLVDRSEELCRSLLPEPEAPEAAAAAAELAPYLCTSFGNEIRIDYGTGHETTFFILLFCLFKLRVLAQTDLPALALHVFRAYLRTTRRLQTTYMLEPAGSRGVWGLDDFACLPFYFGAAQLVAHPTLTPTSVCDADTVRHHASEYLYLDAIAYILRTKQGAPFAEASPMLYDISGLAHWSKVNSGMMKLYVGEVIGKLPVMQHTLFGSLFPATWEASRERVPWAYDPDAVANADVPQAADVGGRAPGGFAGGAMGMAPWASGGGTAAPVEAPVPAPPLADAADEAEEVEDGGPTAL